MVEFVFEKDNGYIYIKVVKKEYLYKLEGYDLNNLSNNEIDIISEHIMLTKESKPIENGENGSSFVALYEWINLIIFKLIMGVI